VPRTGKVAPLLITALADQKIAAAPVVFLTVIIKRACPTNPRRRQALSECDRIPLEQGRGRDHREYRRGKESEIKPTHLNVNPIKAFAIIRLFVG